MIAVPGKDKAAPRVATLVAAYHSPEVKEFITRKYGDAVVASW